MAWPPASVKNGADGNLCNRDLPPFRGSTDDTGHACTSCLTAYSGRGCSRFYIMHGRRARFRFAVFVSYFTFSL